MDQCFLGVFSLSEQALAYAERAGLTVIWIDDPGGLFPPEKRPVRDVGR
jgi:hypothetical protein